MEPYFLKGIRKQEDVAHEEPVPLIYCLAWHPSDDADVWLAEFQRIKLEARCEESMVGSIWTSYSLIKNRSNLSTPLNATENVQSLFLQREKLLYDFLFFNQAFLDDDYVKQADAGRLEALRPLSSGLYCVNKLKGIIESSKNGAPYQPYFYSFSIQHLCNLKGSLTSSLYGLCTVNNDSKEVLGRHLATSLQLYKQRQQYSVEFQTITELWFAQLESDEIAPEWKAIWTDAKAGQYLTDDEYFAQDDADGEVSIEKMKGKLLEEELNKLLRDSASRTEIIECLVDNFEDKIIELFDVTEWDNIRSPYSGFIDPIKQLVELRNQQDRVSYQDEIEDDVLTISLNEKIIGEINLNEIVSNETADYFQAIISLATEWFPDQALLTVEEGSVSLFILPSHIFKLLQEHGIESDLLAK